MPAPKKKDATTRATLINRLKDWQDQTSWQEFFAIYWELIFRVARKAGLSEEEAQDVVQETLCSVARHMPTFKYDPAKGSFKAWLLNQTRWRITDQFRKRGPAVQNPPPGETATGTSPIDKIMDPASHDLDALWEARWEKTLLDGALVNVRRKVDPQKFQVFDFYVNKEWPPEKVAETFSISVSQVYLVKHRVTEMIKEEVKRLEKEAT